MGRSKVAIYARVSTNEQDPEMQLLDLRRYANERGFEIYHEFVDIGNSGAKEIEAKKAELISELPKTEEEKRSYLASKYPLNTPEDFI